jgi:hypothetical protein
MNVLNRKLEQLSAKVDKFINHDKYKKIENLNLKETIFSSAQNACGINSLFTPLIAGSHLSYHENLSDAASIGRLCASDATDMFYKNSCLYETSDIEIDILEVDAISASKSDLNSYDSIEEFGGDLYRKYRNKKHVQNMSENEYFDWCLKGAIPSGNRSFTITEWNSLLKWDNHNGSHRFATAWYMAKKQSRKFSIAGSLISYKFNRPWFDSLAEKYNCFLLSLDYAGSSPYEIFDILDSNNNLIDLSRTSLTSYNSTTELRNYSTYILMINKEYRQSLWQTEWLNRNLKSGVIHNLFEII